MLFQGASPSFLLVLHKSDAESAPAFCNGLVWRVKVRTDKNRARYAVLHSSVLEGVFRPNGIYTKFPVEASA